MSSLEVTNGQFVFSGQLEKKILLDCSKFLDNKSRVSMHRLPGQDHIIIPELLADLLARERENGEDLAFSSFLIDAVLAARLIRTASPVRALEYGSKDGRLSWHLAELLGTFHEESSLVCAYDAIEPQWLERILWARCLPRLSYLSGDFGKLSLTEKFFDIVLVNGLVNFFNPYEVMSDVLRLVHPRGIIMCYIKMSPLLESTFKMYFEKREEFEISPTEKLLIAKAEDMCWEQCGTPDFECRQDVTDLGQVSAMGREEAEQAVVKLKAKIQSASNAGDTERKIRLLAWKEQLVTSLTGGLAQ